MASREAITAMERAVKAVEACAPDWPKAVSGWALVQHELGEALHRLDKSLRTLAGVAYLTLGREGLPEASDA